jgi:hypothetical protein
MKSRWQKSSCFKLIAASTRRQGLECINLETSTQAIVLSSKRRSGRLLEMRTQGQWPCKQSWEQLSTKVTKTCWL